MEVQQVPGKSCASAPLIIDQPMVMLSLAAVVVRSWRSRKAARPLKSMSSSAWHSTRAPRGTPPCHTVNQRRAMTGLSTKRHSAVATL